MSNKLNSQKSKIITLVKRMIIDERTLIAMLEARDKRVRLETFDLVFLKYMNMTNKEFSKWLSLQRYGIEEKELKE